MTQYLLVDCGYFAFYRFHAAKCWYKKAHEYTDDVAMIADEKFQKTLRKRIETSLLDMVKKLGMDISNTILCKDCPRKDIWRNTLLSTYKEGRICNPDIGGAFTIIHQEFENLKNKYNIPIISENQCEADDIVYLVRKFLLEQDNTSKINIVASDIDYYQLVYEGTKIIRLDGRNAMNKSTGNPEKDLYIKIICGDKSDNIPGIYKKCGIKTALKIINNAEKFTELIANPPEQFILNQKLIDMSMIPTELQNTVLNQIKYKINHE